MEDRLSQPLHIVKKETKPPISSLDQLSTYLGERSLLFTHALARSSHGTDFGWMEVSKNFGLIEKNFSKPAQTLSETASNKFTGVGMCMFASFALGEVIETIAPQLKVSIVQFKPDGNAENWQQSNDDINVDPNINDDMYVGSHIIVSVVDESGQKMYFDPTYAQIDHRRVGIVAIKPQEFNNIYRNRNGIDQDHLKKITDEKEAYLEMLAKYGLTPEKYHQVVKSVL